MFLGFPSSPHGKRRFAGHDSPSRGKAKTRVAFQASLEALEGRELLAQLLPNLVPVTTGNHASLYDATIVTTASGDHLLEFSASAANVGAAPFEIRHSGKFYTSGGIQYEEAIQRIYNQNKYTDLNLDPNGKGNGVGDFVGGKFHWFNEYELDAPNGSPIASFKASCDVGDDFLWKTLPGSPSSPVYSYTDGGNKVLGLSVGWADTYYKGITTQWIDLGATAPSPGTYTLKQIVNPDGVIKESNYSDNTMSVSVTIDNTGQVSKVQ